MKINRQIAMITLLLQEDMLTAPELARRFEVSRRTIIRDIEDICRAGIPLATAQGYGGGISIEKGYTLDKTVLTQEDLQLLLAGLKGMNSITNSVQTKALYEKLFHSDAVVSDCFLIDLASFGRSSLSRKIELFKSAIFAHHTVSFQYDYSKGECHRVIEPYHLVFKWSSWYVFGFCLSKEDFRLFKLNRLWDLETSDETFLPRRIPEEKLVFGEHLTRSQAYLKAIFSVSEKYRLIDEYGVGSFTAINDEELFFERDFASYDNLRQWILSFGCKVTVLEPAALKQDLVSEAEKILAHYQQT